jgi:hypothetical protein
MWTVRMLTADAIRLATGSLGRLFPGRLPPASSQPWRIQPSADSEPDETDSAGGWCWQSHQVPPGQSSWWCLRHGTQIMVPIRALDAQAALARRMRRRRSAERSSSFSPPHVPYFSGLETA